MEGSKGKAQSGELGRQEVKRRIMRPLVCRPRGDSGGQVGQMGHKMGKMGALLLLIAATFPPRDRHSPASPSWRKSGRDLAKSLLLDPSLWDSHSHSDSDFELQAKSCKQQTASCKQQTESCKLQKVQTAKSSKFQTAKNSQLRRPSQFWPFIGLAI